MTAETLRTWRHAGASVVGSGHERRGESCQDAFARATLGTSAGEILILIASDGCGSARKGGEGAKLVCEIFSELLREHFGSNDDAPRIDDGALRRWLKELKARVSAQDGESSDYAATLLLAVLTPRYAVFAQVGDGLIVTRSCFASERGPGQEPQNQNESVISDVWTADETSDRCALDHVHGLGCAYVFWPARGDYINETAFVTDPDANESLQFCIVEHDVQQVALLTDGLEPLVVHRATRTLHAPFFDQMFEALCGFEDAEACDEALHNYLRSDTIRSRVDDDVTLLLASVASRKG